MIAPCIRVHYDPATRSDLGREDVYRANIETWYSVFNVAMGRVPNGQFERLVDGLYKSEGNGMGTMGLTAKGKGATGGTLPDSAIVEVGMTASTARTLMRALTLNEPMTGPSVNVLLSEISRVLMVSSTSKPGKGKSLSKTFVSKTQSLK